jgi:hypothetical protein
MLSQQNLKSLYLVFAAGLWVISTPAGQRIILPPTHTSGIESEASRFFLSGTTIFFGSTLYLL